MCGRRKTGSRAASKRKKEGEKESFGGLSAAGGVGKASGGVSERLPRRVANRGEHSQKKKVLALVRDCLARQNAIGDTTWGGGGGGPKNLINNALRIGIPGEKGGGANT